MTPTRLLYSLYSRLPAWQWINDIATKSSSTKTTGTSTSSKETRIIATTTASSPSQTLTSTTDESKKMLRKYTGKLNELEVSIYMDYHKTKFKGELPWLVNVFKEKDLVKLNVENIEDRQFKLLKENLKEMRSQKLNFNNVENREFELLKQNFKKIKLEINNQAKNHPKFQQLDVNDAKNEVIFESIFSEHGKTNIPIKIHLKSEKEISPEILQNLFQTLFHIQVDAASLTLGEKQNTLVPSTSIKNTSVLVPSTTVKNTSVDNPPSKDNLKTETSTGNNWLDTTKNTLNNLKNAVPSNVSMSALSYMAGTVGPYLFFNYAIVPYLSLKGLYDLYSENSQKIHDTINASNEAVSEVTNSNDSSSSTNNSPVAGGISLAIPPLKPTPTVASLASPTKNARTNASPVVEPHLISVNSAAGNSANEAENPVKKLQASPFVDPNTHQSPEPPLNAATPTPKATAATPDLTQQKNEYLILIKEIKELANSLRLKQNSNKKYQEVCGAAVDLHKNLKKEGEEFFSNPNLEALNQLKDHCNTYFTKAEVEFKKHRGIWHNLDPILKKIMGVLATIVFPVALAVAFTSSHGYKATFFQQVPPPTRTELEFNSIKHNLEEVQKDIHHVLRA